MHQRVRRLCGVNVVGCSAVGVAGKLVQSIGLSPLVKYDDATEDVVRGPDGFCVPCKAGEVGELLGFIVPGDPSRAFKGSVVACVVLQ